MKHIGVIKSALIAAVLTTAVLGCGGGARTFSTTDFKESEAWAKQFKSKLLSVEKQGNSIIYKEALDAAEKQVASVVTVGTKIAWQFHVRSVDGDGIKFEEVGPIIFMFRQDESIEVEFKPEPRYSAEQLRALRSGQTVTVCGTISELWLSQFPQGISIRLSDVTLK